MPGYGSGPWGLIPWGTYPATPPGGSVPTASPWDAYLINEEISVLTTFTEVSSDVAGGQVSLDTTFGDTLITSGGVADTYDAEIFIDTPVADQATFDVTFRASELPPNFSDLSTSHLFFGTVNSAGLSAGFFFSKIGIMYTGNVRRDGVSNALVINSALQYLPNSLNIVNETDYFTLRVLTDAATGSVLVYLTNTGDLATSGHQLRFVLPGIETSSCLVSQADGTYIFVRGTVSDPTTVYLNELALGAGAIVPNLPPVANTGRDQSIRACSITRFDGRASFDPEGAQLTYRWRLIDGPETSSFVHVGHDGITTGMVYTDTLYSEFLGTLDAGDRAVVGDVLLYEGVPYDIVNMGGAGPTYFVQISGTFLPPGLSGANFRLLKQNALDDNSSSQPSFYPDITGLFRFDLTVSDGDLSSLPALLLVNVVDSPVPRGITPDLSFLWNYLSDFWKLVEDTDTVDTFWGALAQVAASELLTLWQHDYSKSLRDVQRAFQRKWLHYDLFMRDPYPESTTVSHIYGSIAFAWPAGGIGLGIGLQKLTIESPLFDSFDVFLTAAAGPSMMQDEAFEQIYRQLKTFDSRFTVNRYTENGVGGEQMFVINAPFPFTLTSTTIFGTTVLKNESPRGTVGAVVGVNTYVVERPLYDCDVQENDFLVVGDTAYTISRVVSDSTDSYGYMRIVTKETLPSSLGKTWYVVRGASSKFIDYYTSLCSAGDQAVIEIVNLVDDTVNFVFADVRGAASSNNSKLLLETYDLAQYLAQPKVYSVHVYAVYRRTYLPIESVVVGIPFLQEKVKNEDDSAVLRQNIDYYLETFRDKTCIRFITGSPDVWQNELPPQVMWAEVTFLDNNPVIEANFGIPAGFTLDDLAKLPSTTDYLSVVRGLWYAYFNGPTLFNLRAGTQILLGLPFAEVDGTILEIRADFTSSIGRILVQDASDAALVRSYQYPAILDLEVNPNTGLPYAVGDTVKQFAPLVSGVEVIDYVKDPKWFEGYLNQGVFYEVEKFFKFLVRIDSAAFSLNTLAFVQSFIKKIKPTYTYPVYVVLKKLPPATVETTDEVTQTVTLHLNEWIGQYSFDGSPPIGMVGGTFDDPHAAFGGWRRAFDSGAYVYGDTPLAAPVYPTAASPVYWGYDRDHLVPTDVIVATLSSVYGAPFTVAYDGLFQFDLPAFDALFGIFSGTYMLIPGIPDHTNPIVLGPPKTVGAGGTLNEGVFISRGMYPFDSPVNISIDLVVNSVVVETIPLAIPAGNDYITPIPFTPLVLAPGDVVEIHIYSAADIPMPGGTKLFLAIGHGSVWAFGTPLPAGTYYSPRLM